MFKRMILAFSVSVGASLFNIAQATPVTSVADVDVNRYMGKWYEIARLPMFFQRQCASNVTANYRLLSNGHIEVKNECRKSNGSLQQAVGEAVSQNKANSQLKVTFLPTWLRWLPVGEGDYWILKLDPNYQAVLVGTPNHDYLWILSRTPKISEQTYLEYVEAARQQGFDITKLIRTPQH